jgi:hypothetical protein
MQVKLGLKKVESSDVNQLTAAAAKLQLESEK